MGLRVQNGWRKLADNNKLKIDIFGLPAISTYAFRIKKNLKYKTLIIRNAEKGFLASTNFYTCTEHQGNYLDSYFSALDEVYKLIYKSENGNINIDELLDDEVCHSGFKDSINDF